MSEIVKKDTLIERYGLDKQQIDVVKSTVAKGTTDMELAYFLSVAKSYELSPFKKEVWCYKDNKGNLLVFAGRDGHLAAAQKDLRWNGIASSEVRAKDTFSADIPNGKINHLYGFGDRGEIVGAYAICRPKGCEIATIEVVAFDVYNKGYNTWKSDPAAMIKKVAETHCLKKAYGLSGLASEYDFEVDQATQRVYASDHNGKPTMGQIEYVAGLINTSTLDDEVKAIMDRKIQDCTYAELDNIRDECMANQLDPVTETGRYSQTDLKNYKIPENE